jgi:hypothetical protein
MVYEAPHRLIRLARGGADPVRCRAFASHAGALAVLRATGGVGSVFAESESRVDPGMARSIGGRAPRDTLDLEVRWMSLITEGSTTMVPAILSVAVPPHR